MVVEAVELELVVLVEQEALVAHPVVEGAVVVEEPRLAVTEQQAATAKLGFDITRR
jgi:hypothetical protein